MMLQEVLHQFNMKVKVLCYYSVGQTSLFLTLLYVLLLPMAVHSLPVSLLDIYKRQSPTLEDVRTECHRSNATCDYYSHCLEPMFPCGESGFVLDYAQKRCRELSGKFTSGPIKRWTQESELCLQRKLHTLIREYRWRQDIPDPPTCLRLEKVAITLMNDCYSINNKLCGVVLGDDVDTVPDSTQEDLQRVMDSVRVGGAYYNNIVNQGIPETVRKCGHDELANSLQTDRLPQRIILCTFADIHTREGNSMPTLTETFFIDKLSMHMGIPRHQLVYSGVDEDELCEKNAPDGFNSDNNDEIHIVTLFANQTVSDDYIGYEIIRAADGPTLYFELNYYGSVAEPRGIRDNSWCGDGIRQAGEECDYAGVVSGCNLTCSRDENDLSYDCSTERLQPSICSVEECGDGLRTSSEKCDDGNSVDGDGCSKSCEIEAPNFHCTQEYNKTSVCSPTPTQPPPPPPPPTLSWVQPTLPRHSISSTESPSIELSKDSGLSVSGSSISQLSRTSTTLTVLLTTLLTLCVVHTILGQR